MNVASFDLSCEFYALFCRKNLETEQNKILYKDEAMHSIDRDFG